MNPVDLKYPLVGLADAQDPFDFNPPPAESPLAVFAREHDASLSSDTYGAETDDEETEF